MKKWIYGLAVVLVAGVAFASNDRLGSMRSNVVTASYTATQDQNVMIVISSPVIFYGVEVTSPVATTWINIYGSSVIDVNTSTRAGFSTAQVGTSLGIPVVFPRGLGYNKFGNAGVRILYDKMIDPSNDPR